jgi:putative FmdB family regulatory protein
MPTYEYECGACGHKFEKYQPITAGPIRKCPGCGRLKARRLISAGAGVIFKGSGFYQTDYRSESYKKGAEKDKPASATPAAAPSGSAAGASDAKGAPPKAASSQHPEGAGSKGGSKKH